MTDLNTGVPLAPLTTLGLGGPADRLVEPATEEELVELVRSADTAAEPAFLIAGGSNVVIADEGVRATAVRISTVGIERVELGDGQVELTVQAGEEWDGVVRGAVEDGLAGIECLSGIPGSTGATPIQNVGAYGQEVSSTISGVRVLDRESGEVVRLGPDECGFGYRTSRFKGHQRYLVLAVSFVLARSESSEPVTYPQLAEALGVEVGDSAPLGRIRETVLALRRSKGMVIDPEDPDSVSAGSFFTNPVLSQTDADELVRRAAEALGPEVNPPAWPTEDGRTKTSAAWLIERAGFERGFGDGRVGISGRHTLALINRGGATTDELVSLAHEIADRVELVFGVSLTPEPVFVGHVW